MMTPQKVVASLLRFLLHGGMLWMSCHFAWEWHTQRSQASFNYWTVYTALFLTYHFGFHKVLLWMFLTPRYRSWAEKVPFWLYPVGSWPMINETVQAIDKQREAKKETNDCTSA